MAILALLGTLAALLDLSQDDRLHLAIYSASTPLRWAQACLHGAFLPGDIALLL
jgi:hypothetical protein